MSDLSHWVVRWLCHDLATPIASVMTASELLDDVKPDAEINELIMTGAQRLTGRLRLVRLHYQDSGEWVTRVREAIETPASSFVTHTISYGQAAAVYAAANMSRTL